MNWFEKFLVVLDANMETPVPYGWYHLMCFAIAIACCVLVGLTCKHLTEKQFRIITLIVALVLIVLEVYKQLNFSFNTESLTWSYTWWYFPFQFCSTPMYVLLIVSLLKQNKFREFLCSFLATFGLFAGLIVMIIPTTVFVSTIGINIQTMVHHGAMIVIGVFMFVSGRAKLEHKTILKGASVFAVLFVMALSMNIIYHYAGGVNDFNMFYIGPFIPCSLPVLEAIYLIVPYPVFLIIYFGGFTLAGYVMLLFAMLINKICLTCKKRSSNNNQIKQNE